LQKKRGNLSKANSRVGNADISNILPLGERWVCIQGERGAKDILEMLMLLYNMHARMVGINQIRNTYMKHLTRDANKDVLF
jgi:hypothetical protein